MEKQDFHARQSMMKKDFEIYHNCDKYMKEIDLHHHDFYELYFFISGGVSYDVDGRSYLLCSGDILLISPNELHQPHFEEVVDYERIVLWLSKKYLEELSTSEVVLTKCFQLMKNANKNLLRLVPKFSEEIRELLKRINKINIEKSYGYEMLSESLLKQLLIELVLHIENNPNGLIMYYTTSNLIYSIIKYIDKNLEKELSLDNLAEKHYISKFYLSHEFKKNMGTTLYRYITQKRLILAKELILQNKPIKEVYLSCGYNDLSSFFRMFKKEYGITPKEYYRYMVSIK